MGSLTSALLLLFLGGFSGVIAREYCSNKKACTNDSACIQSTGESGVNYGLCCNGWCQAGPQDVQQGDACDSQCAICAAGTCTNNICVGNTVTYNCNCTQDSDCSEDLGVCLNNLCQPANLANGYACMDDVQCASGSCVTQVCTALALGQLCDNFDYGGVCNGGFCPDPNDWNINPSYCMPYSDVNGNCTQDYECLPPLLCIGNNSVAGLQTCKAVPAVGSPCLTDVNSPSYNCGNVDGVVCNGGICIKTNTVANGGSCDFDDACVSTYCNDTSSKCQAVTWIPAGGACDFSDPAKQCANKGYCYGFVYPNFTCSNPDSLPEGAACYTDSMCTKGSVCYNNGTQNINTCKKAEGAPCNYNSTTSDETQCFSDNYQCTCSNKCDLIPTEDISLLTCFSKYSWLTQDNRNYSVNPLSLPPSTFQKFAPAYCCFACNSLFDGDVPTAAQAGFQINCDPSNFKLTQVTFCNSSMKSGPLFLNCDKYNGGASIHSSPIIAILLFVATLILNH